MKTRLRRCRAPTSAAERPRGTEAYPRAPRARRTRGTHRFAPLATFSTRTHDGPISPTSRSNWYQSPLRSVGSSGVPSPAPEPAELTSWQGKPPTRMSTCPSSAPVTARTSAYLRASGQCVSNTARQKGSISTCQTTSPSPAASRPTSKPPMPANREPILRGGMAQSPSTARASGSASRPVMRGSIAAVSVSRGSMSPSPSTEQAPSRSCWVASAVARSWPLMGW